MIDLFSKILTYEHKINLFFRQKQLSREEREDLTQEVLCRLYESISRYQGKSSLATWIFSVCRYTLYEYYRKNHYNLDIDYYEPMVQDKTESIHYEIIVEKLPPSLKIIYNKKYRLNMTIREISRELAVPEGTVKYRLYEIRKRLRRER